MQIVSETEPDPRPLVRRAIETLRTVARTPGHPMHADDQGEIEHMLAQAERAEQGQADPPEWALNTAVIEAEEDERILAEVADRMGAREWDNVQEGSA